MHVCMHVCMCAYAHVGQKLMLDVFIYASFINSLSLNLELTNSATLAGQLAAPAASCLPLPPALGLVEYIFFYLGAWNLNSSPHVFMANITPIEPHLLCP